MRQGLRHRGMGRRRRQPQHLRGSLQIVQGLRGIVGLHGRRRVLLGKFFAPGIADQRSMQVLGARQPQGLLQHNLARRVVGQVGTAHDVGHALGGVIYHYGKLVGPQTVGAAQDKVAHSLRNGLLLCAQPPVRPVRNGIDRQPLLQQARLHMQTPGMRLLRGGKSGRDSRRLIGRGQRRSACARRDPFRMAGMHMALCSQREQVQG